MNSLVSGKHLLCVEHKVKDPWMFFVFFTLKAKLKRYKHQGLTWQ